ncbi:single-stranded DNA-binding protein [Paraburkholderia sp. HD33-4]|uniref:single-stranded DNA-binding protein n=1 Tax=Paraburkholderia sp. HD33-4 TaxID=2883242 RepID=UPI001F3976D5|nr:single-stranded DNA-binding protein [Paraburkholderia sp. HD33-4]
MSIYAELVGNVLSSPTMKQVTTPNGAKRIVELRIMSASYRRLDDGSLEQKDDRTFPVDVTIWNERHTERVMQHIRTGASVVVKGDLYVNPWITRENEALAGVHIDAESIALNLVRVDQVIFQARQRRNGNAGDAGDSAELDPPPGDAVGPTEFDRPEDWVDSQSTPAG